MEVLHYSGNAIEIRSRKMIMFLNVSPSPVVHVVPLFIKCMVVIIMATEKGRSAGSKWKQCEYKHACIHDVKFA